MDGLARAIGAGVTIEFSGETLILDPLTMEDFGVIEQHLLANRKNPLLVVKEVIRDLPPELGEKLLLKAYEDARRENTITSREVAEWIDTMEGITFSLWLCLEKRYKGRFMLEDVRKIMGAMAEKELDKLKRARDQASGLDELGNSTGQAQEAVAASQ